MTEMNQHAKFQVAGHLFKKLLYCRNTDTHTPNRSLYLDHYDSTYNIVIIKRHL